MNETKGKKAKGKKKDINRDRGGEYGAFGDLGGDGSEDDDDDDDDDDFGDGDFM